VTGALATLEKPGAYDAGAAIEEMLVVGAKVAMLLVLLVTP
jgi:hypothetical protein